MGAEPTAVLNVHPLSHAGAAFFTPDGDQGRRDGPVLAKFDPAVLRKSLEQRISDHVGAIDMR